MTLLSRLHSEVSRFGLNEVADRLREIIQDQERLQKNTYHQNLHQCLYLLEQLVETSDKLEDMEIK